MVETLQIYWQAHRGGGAYEAPDNTMAANLYTWELGGIPEADLRTTKDGEIICLHDATPARTTTVPEDAKDRPISSFTLQEIKQWDAGVKFDAKFKGEKVPTLAEVFHNMQGIPERQIYLDLKEVDLDQLGRLIDEYEVNKQVIFTHNNQENCKRMKTIAANVRTMLWIMGNVDKIKQTYSQAKANDFAGLDQVQIHLRLANDDDQGSNDRWPFELEQAFVREVIEDAQSAGIDFEVFLYSCEEKVVHRLLDEGVRWFATDEPSHFLKSVRSWRRSS